MTSLKSRIEKLEEFFRPKPNGGPGCIVIIPESGRIDSALDESPIVQYSAGNQIYDRLPDETEETFTERVIREHRPKMYSKQSVPCLLAYSEDMFKTEKQ